MLQWEKLSQRELETTQLASKGLKDQEIAKALGVELATVRTYWNRVRFKLGAKSRADVIRTFVQKQGYAVVNDEKITRYRDLAHLVGFVICALEHDQWTIRTVSEIFATSLGFESPALEGKLLSTILTEESFSDVMNTLKSTPVGAAQMLAITFRTPILKAKSFRTVISRVDDDFRQILNITVIPELL